MRTPPPPKTCSPALKKFYRDQDIDWADVSFAIDCKNSSDLDYIETHLHKINVRNADSLLGGIYCAFTVADVTWQQATYDQCLRIFNKLLKKLGPEGAAIILQCMDEPDEGISDIAAKAVEEMAGALRRKSTQKVRTKAPAAGLAAQ